MIEKDSLTTHLSPEDEKTLREFVEELKKDPNVDQNYSRNKDKLSQLNKRKQQN